MRAAVRSSLSSPKAPSRFSFLCVCLFAPGWLGCMRNHRPIARLSLVLVDGARSPFLFDRRLLLAAAGEGVVLGCLLSGGERGEQGKSSLIPAPPGQEGPWLATHPPMNVVRRQLTTSTTNARRNRGRGRRRRAKENSGAAREGGARRCGRARVRERQEEP